MKVFLLMKIRPKLTLEKFSLFIFKNLSKSEQIVNELKNLNDRYLKIRIVIKD